LNSKTVTYSMCYPFHTLTAGTNVTKKAQTKNQLMTFAFGCWSPLPLVSLLYSFGHHFRNQPEG